MDIILEYKNHFMNLLAQHHDKHGVKPVDGKHRLSTLNNQQKSGFFKHLKSSWAAVKASKLQKSN